MRKAVYVLGCNRSGTTLLQNLFRCAADTKVVNGEISAPATMLHLQEHQESNLVMKRVMGPFFGMNLSGLSAAPTEGSSRSHPTLWLDWVTNWDKLHYVHIRRDPRDSVTSLMSGGGRHYVSSFPMWKSAEQIYERLLVELPEQTHLVKYEELVTSVSSVMDNLFNKIGLTRDLDYNQWFERVNDQERKHPFNHWLGGARPPDVFSIGKWQRSIEALRRLQAVIDHNPDFVKTVSDYGYTEGEEGHWEEWLKEKLDKANKHS